MRSSRNNRVQATPDYGSPFIVAQVSGAPDADRCPTRRIHWTARSAGVYISSITDAPPVMRVVIPADPVRLFRALVLTSTGTYLLLFFEPLLGRRLISSDTRNALSWHGYGALLPLPERLGWLFLLLFVAVAVGLWTFSKSARLVFAMLAAFFLVTCPLAGVQVQTAFGSSLLLLTNMADGAILVMAYTAPLQKRFK
jgi:hypothetical protein